MSQYVQSLHALACAALPDRDAAARVADALPALGCSYFMAHHAVALGWSATAGARRSEAADLLAEAGNHLYRIYRKLGVENRRALRGLQTWH